MKKRIVSVVSVWMLLLSVFLGAQFTTVAAPPQFVAEKLIIYDNGHDPHISCNPPYYEAAKFINLTREYGTVYMSNSTLTPELLRNATLLVIPSPDDAPGMQHTPAEIQAIKDFVENGGALFIMGTYYAYFDPSWYDPITSDYGIKWVDGSMNDKNDHDQVYGYEYFVLLDTFPDNELANTLKQNVTNIMLSGTSLNITDPANVNPIVTGDLDPGENRTVTYDGPAATANVIYNGTDVIPLVGVELPGGGRMIASGSDFIIRVRYEFFDHNEQFLRNLLDWLLRGTRTTFEATWEETTYNVTILSNSIVNYFNFSQPPKQISFNVTGADGTGFCYVNIPKALFDPQNWVVQLDGVNITDFTVAENERINYTFIYFTYNYADHSVIIIPEFPAWSLTLLMLPLLAVGAALLRRKIQSLVKHFTSYLGRGGK